MRFFESAPYFLNVADLFLFLFFFLDPIPSWSRFLVPALILFAPSLRQLFTPPSVTTFLVVFFGFRHYEVGLARFFTGPWLTHLRIFFSASRESCPP